jgi:sulfatase modifying factor 1
MSFVWGGGKASAVSTSVWCPCNAARFTNWLTNDQGTGDTEDGVYDLTDGAAISNNTVTRNSDAWNAGGVAIASEDEWYKAAYYQPSEAGGDSDNYWLYPTASNSITRVDANYGNGAGAFQNVGHYSFDPSYYGTFDQAGNAWEWNDSIASGNSSHRVTRGGAFDAVMADVQSLSPLDISASSQFYDTGFRVSILEPIPEPSSYAAMFGCLALTYAIMRRKGRRTL